MDKTRVDDMLIEMITPKVKEIEEKFSQGKGLTQEDINTLLLKSQYNHINHLDDKLNEVTASVVGLERKFDGKFSDMENRFVGLENRFEGLENKFELLNEKIEHTIQKALNKNMIMLMGMMGFFLTLSKALDIFIK
jgi:uncharacterized coiled-coil DUF342 family protein